MCNRYEQHLRKMGIRSAIEDFSDIKVPLRWPAVEHPNRGVFGTLKPTDPAWVIRPDGEVQVLSWGFPSKRGPVINVRDDNHPYSISQRGLAPLTSFYESVDPADPKKKTKDWYEFTPAKAPEGKGALMFAVAILHEGFYSLITTNPGPDPASIGKDRQPTILTVEEWDPWLRGSNDLFKPSPAGMFSVAPKVFPKETKAKT